LIAAAILPKVSVMKLEEIRKSAVLRMLMLSTLYTAAFMLSLAISYLLRFDFNLSDPIAKREVPLARDLWKWIIPLKLAFLVGFRQFEGLLSYFSLPDLRRLFFAVFGSSLVIFFAWLLPDRPAPPRSVILADFVLSLTFLTVIRVSFRMYRERFLTKSSKHHGRARRVGIIGAGDVGASLARELMTRRSLGLTPVVFFDDDRAKWHSRVHDIPVVGSPEALLEADLNLELEEVIIAMPSAPAKRIGEVVKILQRSHLRFETVPSIDQLATGQVKVSQLRNVEIQDLLGRPPVKLDSENIRQVLANRVVAVTGAGGSIGSELCRQIASFNPTRLLLIEQSEVQMFQIEQELIERGFGGIMLPLVADILDDARMRYIFERFKPNVIFHAAAHKHVPMMESQPSEAIKNNTFGTAHMCDLALEYGVERFVLISTDKAINPTNVMGASKRLAEIYLQALHAANSSKTKFMAVRFGNVLGSSGSVIPVFNKQIAAGGPVKVTHPDVTRYFMTIPEAAGLVLQSGAQGSGGEIFVLDMGQPVKIVDLARSLIELTGLKPGEDIEIEFVGLRPGEKLFEELSHQGENITSTHHPKIMRFVSDPQPVAKIKGVFENLAQEIHRAEPGQIKMILKEAVPEYQPYLT
jgi:FlaA1/EpsC-like NDP-sugar epimerase